MKIDTSFAVNNHIKFGTSYLARYRPTGQTLNFTLDTSVVIFQQKSKISENLNILHLIKQYRNSVY